MVYNFTSDPSQSKIPNLGSTGFNFQPPQMQVQYADLPLPEDKLLINNGKHFWVPPLSIKIESKE